MIDAEDGRNRGGTSSSAAADVPERGRSSRRGIIHHAPWLVFAASLLVTWAAWNSAADTLVATQGSYFDFRVRDATNRIQQRMQAYQQVLLGVQGLHIASDNVERHEFKDYVEALELDEHYPGIQGVGFSLIVPASRREEHEAAIRREGFPAYAIRPEGERDPYTSIVYLEPFSDRNLRAFGYDMFSEPVRRAAMERARDSGLMALSGKVRLVQESGGEAQAGFLLYLPLYRNGVAHATQAQRRASILGWAYAPFRMDDLIHGIFGEQANDLDIEIYDDREASAATLMYDSDRNREAASARGPLHSSTVLEIAGHPWVMHIRALAGLRSRVDTDRPALVVAVGGVISLLLAWLTWALVTGRESALSAVRERELLIAKLQDALAQIRTLQGILPICSVCKKIRDDKDAWQQMETFISKHSEAVFSHGYCPDCAAKALEEVKRHARGTRQV